jgi:hypothetical protein
MDYFHSCHHAVDVDSFSIGAQEVGLFIRWHDLPVQKVHKYAGY